MTTQKLEEALPCPFCGGKPDTVERPDNIDGTQFFFAVACYCGGYSATAHKMAVRRTPEQAKADAIAAWNTRHEAEQAAEAAARPLEPLTDEQRRVLFDKLQSKVPGHETPRQMFDWIARAIERAHGIGITKDTNK